MNKQEIRLSDLSQCRPSTALDKWMVPGKWGIMPYETEFFSGKMLWAAAAQKTPEVSLKLPARGWHKIYIATHYADVGNPRIKLVSENTIFQSLRVRLKSDSTDWHVEPEKFGRQGESFLHFNSQRMYHFVEVLWRAVDLQEDEEIIFGTSQGDGMRDMSTNIACVRLVPMTDEEIRLFSPVPEDAATRRLIAIHDGQFTGNQPKSEWEIREWIEPLQGSDFDIVMWPACRGEGSLYPTKAYTPVNQFYHGGIDPYYRGRDLTETIGTGFDPLTTAVDVAHACGLRIFSSIRMIGAKLPPNQGPYQIPSVFWDNPDYQARTLEGHSTGTYSLAHPEVTKMFIALFREQVSSYEVDGIHLHFNRGYPFILYEDVAVQGFQKKTGIDPKTLDPLEESWHRYKTDIITNYVREIHSMLDEEGEKKQRRFEFAVHVGNSLKNCEFMKLDISTWVKEGLVQHVILHPAYSGESIEDKEITRERYQMVKDSYAGGSAKLYVDVYPRQMPAEILQERAIEYADWPVDGLCYWDSYQRMSYASLWAMMRLSGHGKELKEHKDLGKSFLKAIPFKSILGMTLDRRYWPGNNG